MNKLIINLMIVFVTTFLFVSVAEAKKGGFSVPKISGIKSPVIKTTPKPIPKSTPKDIYKEKDSTNRAINKTLKADKPLEPVLSTKSTHGHGHSKHGYQTTAQQHKDRVAKEEKTTFVSSKFSNPKKEAEALARGEKKLNEKLKNENIPKFTNGQPTRIPIFVDTKDPKGFGDAYVKKLDNNGKPIKDSKGQYVTEKSKDVLKRVQLTYEYVPSKNDWYPVTYYPIK